MPFSYQRQRGIGGFVSLAYTDLAGVRPTCLYTTTGFYFTLGTERKKHVLEFPKEAIFVNRLQSRVLLLSAEMNETKAEQNTEKNPLQGSWRKEIIQRQDTKSGLFQSDKVHLCWGNQQGSSPCSELFKEQRNTKVPSQGGLNALDVKKKQWNRTRGM